VLLGCQALPFLNDGVPQDVAAPPVERLNPTRAQAARLEEGRAIYLTTCIKCHQPKTINEFTADTWTTKILPKEAKKAKLSDQELDMLRAYVLAARAGSAALVEKPAFPPPAPGK
jgi:mono/diheme cytochrome c family protein